MSISGGVIEAFESQLGRVMLVTTAFEGRATGMSLIRLAAIHCRMLAHAEALLPLARVGCVPAIPTLLRSELDGYIDFHLLYQDDDYWDVLQLDYLRSRRDAYQALFEPHRAEHLPAHDIDMQEARKLLRGMHAAVEKLEGKGTKKLTAVERFERAGCNPSAEVGHSEALS